MSSEWNRRLFLKLGILPFTGLAKRDLLAQPGISETKSRFDPNSTELCRMKLVDLVKMMRTREVSCKEVIEAHLARIHALNGDLNAVTIIFEEEARRAADRADQLFAKGKDIPALLGIPMTVKENIDVAGSATTQGIAALRDNIAAEDSPHIAQLRRAGAIPIGRTNLPDLGLRWHTHSGLHGQTRNPWNASHTSGGSSGGDAVAVAAGMAPLGLGNDYGGSLRYPAQCCGIAAIRPSRGRVPYYSAGQNRHEWSLTLQLFAVQGPMGRSIGDLRLALSQMSGYDSRDPWWTPAPLQGPAPPTPIRVAYTVNPGNREVHPDVAAGVLKAARALSAAGYQVEEAEPPQVVEAAQIWCQLVAAEIRTSLQEITAIASPDAVTFLQHFLALNEATDLTSYIASFTRRNSIQRQWSIFLQRFPLILGPISTAPPFAAGYDLEGIEEVRKLIDSMRFILSVSVFGYPAVAVPVGMASGIPQGVQIIGSMYREDLCLDAAEAIEKAVGTISPIDRI